MLALDGYCPISWILDGLVVRVEALYTVTRKIPTSFVWLRQLEPHISVGWTLECILFSLTLHLWRRDHFTLKVNFSWAYCVMTDLKKPNPLNIYIYCIKRFLLICTALSAAITLLSVETMCILRCPPITPKDPVYCKMLTFWCLGTQNLGNISRFKTNHSFKKKNLFFFVMKISKVNINY